MPHVAFVVDLPDAEFGISETDTSVTPELLLEGVVVEVTDDDVRITTDNETRITPEAYIRTVGSITRTVTSVQANIGDIT